MTDLQSHLQSFAQPVEYKAPWGLRWLDRLTAPENPFVLRFVFACAVLLYIAGFLFDRAMLIGSFGLLFMCWPLWEDREKLRRERRLEDWRAQMNEFEQLFRNHATLPARMRKIYGPGADCEGMGV